MIDTPVELLRFVRGECDSADFPHREHVRMAFEMLRRHDFVETALHYSRALRTMAERAGKPQAFHHTITIAFLALIGERMLDGGHENFDAFERENGDLFEKTVLARRYSRERLASAAARRSFLLPDLPP